MKKTALISGATGLVGRALVRHLLEQDYYDQIVVLTRRDLLIKDNRLRVVLLDSYEHLDQYKQHLDLNDVYCALGTTLKKAGSKENFRRIDVDYPLMLARAVKDQPNFEQFLIVTAIGANPDSPLFYNQIKGELEKQLEQMNFASLKIFQPSLLLGYRDDFRFVEEMGKLFSSIFSFFLIGSHAQLWSIKGIDVARAMFQVAKQHKPGVKRYRPGKMRKLAHS